VKGSFAFSGALISKSYASANAERMQRVSNVVPVGAPRLCSGIRRRHANVDLGARVDGFIDKCLFTDGADVKEGDPLFVIEMGGRLRHSIGPSGTPA